MMDTCKRSTVLPVLLPTSSATKLKQLARLPKTKRSTSLTSCSSQIHIPTIITFINDQMDQYYLTIIKKNNSKNKQISNNNNTSILSLLSFQNQNQQQQQQSKEPINYDNDNENINIDDTNSIPDRFKIKNSMNIISLYDALLIPITIVGKTDNSNSVNEEHPIIEQQQQCIVQEGKYIRGRQVLTNIHNKSCSNQNDSKNQSRNDRTSTTFLTVSDINQQQQQHQEQIQLQSQSQSQSQPNTESSRQQQQQQQQDVVQTEVHIQDNNTTSLGSICFVIRRPGCSFCQKQILEILLLTILYPNVLHGFTNFWFIIKDTDDTNGIQTLITLIQNNISTTTNISLYCDKSYLFYNSLGNKKISFNQLLLSPNTLLRGVLCEIWNQWKEYINSSSSSSTSTSSSASNKNSDDDSQKQQQQQKEQRSISKTQCNTTNNTNTSNDNSTGSINTSESTDCSNSDSRSSSSSSSSSTSTSGSLNGVVTTTSNNISAIITKQKKLIKSRNTSTGSTGSNNSTSSNSNAGTSSNTTGSNGKGEGLTLGGIIVFDSITNLPLLTYEEEPGASLPLVEFVQALHIIRQNKNKNKNEYKTKIINNKQL